MLEAAGLGGLCVWESYEEPMGTFVQYRQSLELQKCFKDHLKLIIDAELGLFNTWWIPLQVGLDGSFGTWSPSGP